MITVAEQEALRVSPPLLAKKSLTVKAGGLTPLGEFGEKAAQAEISAVFQIPKVQ